MQLDAVHSAVDAHCSHALPMLVVMTAAVKNLTNIVRSAGVGPTTVFETELWERGREELAGTLLTRLEICFFYPCVHVRKSQCVHHMYSCVWWYWSGEQVPRRSPPAPKRGPQP